MMGASVLDAYYQKMVWAADETHASAHEASLQQRYPSQATPQVMKREYKPIETTIRPLKLGPVSLPERQRLEQLLKQRNDDHFD